MIYFSYYALKMKSKWLLDIKVILFESLSNISVVASELENFSHRPHDAVGDFYLFVQIIEKSLAECTYEYSNLYNWIIENCTKLKREIYMQYFLLSFDFQFSSTTTFVTAAGRGITNTNPYRQAGSDIHNNYNVSSFGNFCFKNLAFFHHSWVFDWM